MQEENNLDTDENNPQGGPTMTNAPPSPSTAEPSDTQRDALRLLHADPGAVVESGTLGWLRRHGFARQVTETHYAGDGSGPGRVKTTSPLTPKGLVAIGVQS